MPLKGARGKKNDFFVQLVEALTEIEPEKPITCSKRIEAYPTPWLQLNTDDDHDFVPLPLPVADAKHIQSASKSISATIFELSTDKFKLSDAWQAHVEKLKFEAAILLRVDSPRDVKVKLSKLIFMKAGSAPRSIANAAASKECIGTLAMALPSLCTGGATRLSRGEVTNEHKLNDHGFVAWYRDASDTYEDIQEGYSLKLMYNLMQPTTTTRKSDASRAKQTTTKLDKALGLWRKAYAEECLQKKNQAYLSYKPEPKYKEAYYRLENRYKDQRLSKEVLNDIDRVRVETLEQKCSKHHFKLYLGHTKRTIEGRHRHQRKDSQHFDRDEGEDGDDLDVYEVKHDEVSTYSIYDFQGNILSGNVELDKDAYINGYPHDRAPVAASWDQDGSISHTFRDAVILIVPCGREAEFFASSLHFSDGVEVARNVTRLCMQQQTETDTYGGFALKNLISRIREHNTTLREEAIEVKNTILGKRLRPFTNEVIMTIMREFPVQEFPLPNEKDTDMVDDLSRALTRPVAIESFDLICHIMSKQPYLAARPILDQAIWPLSPQERQAVLEHLQQSKFRGNASDELDASAIESVVESIITANSQNDDNVNLLVKIMKDSSPKDFLATKFEPVMRRHIDSALQCMQTLILLFEKRAQLRISDEDFREIFAGLIVDLLRILQTSYKHDKNETELGNHLTSLCAILVELGMRDGIQMLLEYVSYASTTLNIACYHPHLLSFLRNCLSSIKVYDPELSKPECRKVYQEVLYSYVKRFVGPEPTEDDLIRPAVGCLQSRFEPVWGVCHDCPELDHFLLDPEASTHRFRINTERRGHLELYMRGNAGDPSDVSTETIKTTGSHTLVVTKTHQRVAERREQWTKRRDRALEDMQDIASEKELRQLLGEYYDSYMSMLVLQWPQSPAGQTVVQSVLDSRFANDPEEWEKKTLDEAPRPSSLKGPASSEPAPPLDDSRASVLNAAGAIKRHREEEGPDTSENVSKKQKSNHFDAVDLTMA